MHDFLERPPYTASQQDSIFGTLNVHFTDVKFNAKFLANGGSIRDEFSVTKTVKKGIQIQDKHCAISQTSKTESQSKSDSSGSSKDGRSFSSKDETSKSKISKIIQKEVKQKIDKKIRRRR